MTESQSTAPVIGNAAARAIHGYSSGADCLLTGGAEAAVHRWSELVDQICRPATVRSVDDLDALAVAADNGSGPLVLADPELDLAMPATLDLLDSPGDRTAALVADPRNIEAPRQPEHDLDRATLIRVDADGRLQAGPAGGARLVLGLLRISAADRPRVAELWRAAAEPVGAGDASELFDHALQVLIDGGIGVGAATLGYYTWSRGPAGQTGLGSSPWKQRLRSASRLGDGAYSAAVVRPLSRIGTRLGLALGLTPNPVTMISLLVGIGSGLLILTGNHLLWIVAAVLLQLALVIDCMDGEIARFTRRFSSFGGWLDGIGDRVKEYLVFAAVAAVAIREGHPSGWLLAMIAMVIVTARHLEDYAYADRTAAVRAAGPVRPSTGSGTGATGSGTGVTGSGALATGSTRRQRIAFWGKKIAHVPIAERYLILSLGLLTGQPIWVLVAAIAVSSFALVWTVGGRFLRAVRDHRTAPARTLDHQLDVGVLARSTARRGIAFLPGALLLIVSWLVTIAGICTQLWPLTVLAGLVAVLITGCTLRPPVTHRLAWLALPMVWAAESAVLGSLLSWSVPGVLIFCTLAVIAYRRYELIYSIRLRGVAGPEPVLGFDGRILLVAVLTAIAALTPQPGAVLGWGLVVLAVETLIEAVVGTVRRWRSTPAQERS